MNRAKKHFVSSHLGPAPAAAVGLLLLLAAPAAHTQDDRGFSVQNFETAPGQGSFLTVESAAVPESPVGFQVGGMLGYQYRPLVIRSCESIEDGACTEWGDEEVALVAHHLMLEPMAALSFSGVFEAGLVLPVVLFQTGDALTGDGASGDIAAPSGKVGLGDPRLHLKLDLLHGLFETEQTVFDMAIVAVVGFPLGNAVQSASFMGDSTFTVHPKLAFGFDFGRLRLGLNGGYLVREEKDFHLAEVGSRISYGAAAEVGFTERLSGIAEVFGQNGVTRELSGSPLEGALALRYRYDSGVALTGGAGTGIIAGIGTPVVRVFLGLAWSPPPETGPGDRDGDGLPDDRDACPDDPEDRDGFEDEDGCPDPDNDADGILDVDDRCPNEPETANGHEDEDGCPDAPPLVKVSETRIEILDKINFATDSAEIVGQRSFEILDQVRAVLESYPGMELEIQGHTDNRGGRKRNLDLSRRRAQSVLSWLTGKGIAAGRLEAAGFGQEKPVAGNAKEDGRAANRRVEFRITKR
jgi:outer membrane protein OmpA-like peptidoglycan-associated protein